MVRQAMHQGRGQHQGAMEQRPESLTHSAPVIVHYSIARSPLFNCLLKHPLKVRVSENILTNSLIFPMSRIAFYYLPLNSTLTSDLNKYASIFDSVDKFNELHGHGYVVLMASTFGDKEVSFLEELQARYLTSQLQIFPVKNAEQAVEAMVELANLQFRPIAAKIKKWFWSLSDRLLLGRTIDYLLALLGLDSHQIQLVQDCLGSLSQLATASHSNLMECALDSETSQRILDFFEKKD